MCTLPSPGHSSCPLGSCRARFPLLLLLALAPAVDGLGADAQFAEPEGAKAQLKVLGDLPSFGPDVLQPLPGREGQVKVTDGGSAAWRGSSPRPTPPPCSLPGSAGASSPRQQLQI